MVEGNRAEYDRHKLLKKPPKVKNSLPEHHNKTRGIKLKTFVRSNASDRQGGNELAIAFINNFHYLQTAPICIVANACAVQRYCGHSLNRCIVVLFIASRGFNDSNVIEIMEQFDWIVTESRFAVE
ncbi:hypothetical protein CEXT_354791 [Caerostris extrusa]|uniref:Uncharacterized protein n=1 Tax=Caerostris extrusa TaxID=172846 RepID=A0AAV4S6Y0_CAEEX|nr:hypothetical protein CEXT_354791 [Caerostris extrusa]